MCVHLSIKAKLVLGSSAGKELKSTMEEFNRACNTLSELTFQRDLHRKYDIHHQSYRLIRQETNLPSQHVINAIAKVSAVPETASSIYSASSRLDGVVDIVASLSSSISSIELRYSKTRRASSSSTTLSAKPT
jgi:hypothetical protein